MYEVAKPCNLQRSKRQYADGLCFFPLLIRRSHSAVPPRRNQGKVPKSLALGLTLLAVPVIVVQIILYSTFPILLLFVSRRFNACLVAIVKEDKQPRKHEARGRDIARTPTKQTRAI